MTGFVHQNSSHSLTLKVLGKKLLEDNFSLFSHVDIAMPSASPAERTQDSSSGKTSVTVYHCKDCEISACELPDYEIFAKIGETQNVKFSNEKIHLVTSEINITMCFLQENTFPEGIYAIFWKKDVGVGDSCGIVDFEGMLYQEPGCEHMENIFLVMKLNCYILGQMVKLMSKLTYQKEFLL